MVKRFGIKIENTEDYLSLFNGIFNLSPTEKEILAEFIDIYNSLKNSSLNINPFSTEMKKKVAENLGRDDFNTLNNYIKSLNDKGAIKKSTDGYEINKLLIPMNEDHIEIHPRYE